MDKEQGYYDPKFDARVTREGSMLAYDGRSATRVDLERLARTPPGVGAVNEARSTSVHELLGMAADRAAMSHAALSSFAARLDTVLSPVGPDAIGVGGKDPGEAYTVADKLRAIVGALALLHDRIVALERRVDL